MKALLFLLALAGSLMTSAKEKKLILHQNGKVQYEYETEGALLDGRFSCYYETGKLRIKGQFKANQKTGQWRYWDQNGILRAERIYSGNRQFTVVREFDSTGARISSTAHNGKEDCDFKDYFFTHKYISSIHNNDPLNVELFTENGLVSQLMHQVHMGNLDLFADDNFEIPLSKASVQNYDYNNVVSILVKESYHWCSKEQTLNNKVVGICPVVMEKGNRKELGWVYVPGLTNSSSSITKIRDHAYASIVTKTTATDVGIRLQEVLPGQNDLMRLLLIQLEANAILYKIDYQTSLATNR